MSHYEQIPQTCWKVSFIVKIFKDQSIFDYFRTYEILFLLRQRMDYKKAV